MVDSLMKPCGFSRLMPAMALALVVFPIGRVSAQSSDTTIANVLHDAVAHGWTLRIASRGDTVTARATDVTATELKLVGHRIEILDIQAIERRERKGGGGVTVALLGAAALGVLVYSVERDLCEHNCSWQDGAVAGGIGGLLGGTLGYFLGVVLDRPPERWVMLWRIAGTR